MTCDLEILGKLLYKPRNSLVTGLPDSLYAEDISRLQYPDDEDRDERYELAALINESCENGQLKFVSLIRKRRILTFEKGCIAEFTTITHWDGTRTRYVGKVKSNCIKRNDFYNWWKNQSVISSDFLEYWLNKKQKPGRKPKLPMQQVLLKSVVDALEEYAKSIALNFDRMAMPGPKLQKKGGQYLGLIDLCRKLHPTVFTTTEKSFDRYRDGDSAVQQWAKPTSFYQDALTYMTQKTPNN